MGRRLPGWAGVGWVNRMAAKTAAEKASRLTHCGLQDMRLTFPYSCTVFLRGLVVCFSG
jgi:hypothetical protein